MPIIGTSPDSIDLAEDRERFAVWGSHDHGVRTIVGKRGEEDGVRYGEISYRSSPGNTAGCDRGTSGHTRAGRTAESHRPGRIDENGIAGVVRELEGRRSERQ